jgi:hypothetical protein
MRGALLLEPKGASGLADRTTIRANEMDHEMILP